MPWVRLKDGWVTKCATNQGPRAITVGPRCALLPNGDLLCSFMFTAALARSDFLPVLFRSTDSGETWTKQGPIWPDLQERWSIYVSISRDPGAGDLFLFGSRTPIDNPGESFWSEATQGLKQNELIWARSTDLGRTWTSPAVIPMPIPGAAEAPGAMCITRQGRWLAVYSPYNTFNPEVTVERNQVVVVRSDDRGKTWSHTSMLRFSDVHSGGAEAWVIELADGNLLGTSWHISHGQGKEYPNAFALSMDGGLTWQPTQSTGIMGQSTALAALPNGGALFIYNQRKHGKAGVWLAEVQPTETDFGVRSNEIIWRAATPTQSGSSGQHEEWQDFSFGEPAVVVLPDGTLLAMLWCIQPGGRGIYYVKLTRNA